MIECSLTRIITLGISSKVIFRRVARGLSHLVAAFFVAVGYRAMMIGSFLWVE